jgi:hypothetical protein
LLVDAGPSRAPEIEIEKMRQLRRCGLRHQIGAVLEPDGIDDTMQQLGPQLRRQRREALNEFVWQADESTGSTDSQTDCFCA